MKQYRLSILSLAVILASLLLSAPCGHAARLSQPADSLLRHLSQVTTAADSLPILLNLYDAADRAGKNSLNHTIYPLAKRANAPESVQLDLLRQIANCYNGDDSIQRIVLDEVMRHPESPDRHESELFIRLLIIYTRAHDITDDQRDKAISDIIQRLTKDMPADQLEQLELYYSLCIYLSQMSRGEVLGEYMSQAEKIIRERDWQSQAVPNMYYTHAGIIYTEAELYGRAVQSDKRLLLLIDELQKRYHSQGRTNRNYRTYKYICYRRMLSNYPALSDREIKAYADSIRNLAREDADVAADISKNHLADIYYDMATGRYAEALPLLKPYLDPATEPVKSFNRHKIFRFLEEAAEATGDSTTLLATARLRNKLLEQLLASKSEERYRELNVLYEVDKLKSERNSAELEARESIISSHQTRLIITAAALAILAIVTIALYRLYTHARGLSRKLKASNTKLEAQRDSLATAQRDLVEAQDRARKAGRARNEFIANMSHEVRDPLDAISGYTQLIADNIDDSKRRYLQTYVDIVALNTELIQTLINDVLDLSEADNSRLSINRRPVRIEDSCHTALECVRRKVNPAVTLSFDQGNCPADLIVDTDPRRVEQVIVNLLQNAIKFTARGNITLSTDIDAESSTLSIAVTDTGTGVPDGMEEKIFERYEKANPSTKGWGLGLSISRQVARLLGGDVRLDTAYTRGARFIFTIPLDGKTAQPAALKTDSCSK